MDLLLYVSMMLIIPSGAYIFEFVYSVLVHSGGVHGGHYYAFIRPTLSDQWYGSSCEVSQGGVFVCLLQLLVNGEFETIFGRDFTF